MNHTTLPVAYGILEDLTWATIHPDSNLNTPLRQYQYARVYLQHRNDTRLTDWCVSFTWGPVKIYQPVEGGRIRFRNIPGRYFYPFRQRSPFRTVCNIIASKLNGSWDNHPKPTPFPQQEFATEPEARETR